MASDRRRRAAAASGRPSRRSAARRSSTAALEIAREEGVDALSMRRLAQALDTGPASLYVYVANRDELHALLFDAAIGTIETEPTDPERWREQLKALGRRMVKMMAEDFPGIAHPGDGAHPDRRQRAAGDRVDARAAEGGRRVGPGRGLRRATCRRCT